MLSYLYFKKSYFALFIFIYFHFIKFNWVFIDLKLPNLISSDILSCILILPSFSSSSNTSSFFVTSWQNMRISCTFHLVSHYLVLSHLVFSYLSAIYIILSHVICLKCKKWIIGKIAQNRNSGSVQKSDYFSYILTPFIVLSSLIISYIILSHLVLSYLVVLGRSMSLIAEYRIIWLRMFLLRHQRTLYHLVHRDSRS